MGVRVYDERVTENNLVIHIKNNKEITGIKSLATSLNLNNQTLTNWLREDNNLVYIKDILHQRVVGNRIRERCHRARSLVGSENQWSLDLIDSDLINPTQGKVKVTLIQPTGYDKITINLNGSGNLKTPYKDLYESAHKYPKGVCFYNRRHKVQGYGSGAVVDIECPICSFDSYVNEGLCSGVFTNSAKNIINGVVSCRCGQIRYTQAQREFQIKSICDDEGLTFIQWGSPHGYKVKADKFTFINKLGVVQEQCVREFIKVGKRDERFSGGYYKSINV